MEADTDRLTERRDSQDSSPRANMYIVYIQCYFVTIATILGTGILGLPVTLSHSGLYPFLVSFLIGFVIQCLLVYFFVEILQRAYAAQEQISKWGGCFWTEKDPLLKKANKIVPLHVVARVKGATSSHEHIPLQEEEDEADEKEITDGMLAGHVILPKRPEIRSPDLHMLGTMFLTCGVQQAFDLIVFLHFISILISYALAGSEAYAQMFGVPHFYVIPGFVWILTFAVVFIQTLMQPVISLFTLVKGSLLIATVVVTFFVGAEVSLAIRNDFNYIGAPFLMGTVALGGVVNVMPMLYQKISPVTTQVKHFRGAVVAGISTCTVLNILWCWAVLHIVPQLPCSSMSIVGNTTASPTVTPVSVVTTVSTLPPVSPACSQNLSLERSANNGEIATLPLTEIIQTMHPEFSWVAILVQLFIMISITVSYLTLGSAMHHTVVGWVEGSWNEPGFCRYAPIFEGISKCCTPKCICQSLISLFIFAIVFTVAMLDPQGFVQILDRGTSLFINLECGVFIFLMVRNARSGNFSSLDIPLETPWLLYHLHWLVALYFTFAVGYDIVDSIYITAT
ncbi:Hypp7295 [Branchiostoma lanceolatum]|uniref:Hypp7295 protein n=2 Tax=Branchiostoma lanceolatum TaxID=7740 RepID=A0A8J9YZ26_BRALA|nr:Hypp7295 [Branchiostoma lanceolatum]